MCGRAACSLDPDSLSCACGYEDASGKHCKVPWVESEVKYTPLCNIGPRDVIPCVVNGSHFQNDDERVLCAMMWGMIPPWHKGDYRKHNMSTHNARLEGVTSSKLYSVPLRKGQRCVVVCDGYYEWKAGNSKKEPKQPYYIYSTQENGIKADDPTTWTNKWDEKVGWQGFKPLKLAGLFNSFKTAEGKIIYSCTMITKKADKVISWIHDRVPVIIPTEEGTQAWLDQNVSANEAVDTLNALSLSETALSWHPVSTMVNNVLCKSDDCRKRIQLKEEKKSGPSTSMASWLKRGSTESAKRKSVQAGDELDDRSTEGEKPLKIAKRN